MGPRKPIVGIDLDPGHDELIGGYYLVTQLAAHFDVACADRSCRVEQIGGGYREVDSERKKRAAVVRANAKPEGLLRKLSGHGLDVDDAAQRFEYPNGPASE